VLRTLGSLRTALERLGHHTSAPPVTDDEILDALRAYAVAYAHPPTVAIWRTERRRPSASVIIRRHGSWKAAVDASLAGLPTGSSGS
jgi:Homing endonuclease associated repeat